MLIDKFLEYENNNNLFQLKINDFYYWPYIRKTIYDEISNHQNEIGQAHTSLNSESYINRILLKLKQLPYWLFKNPLWRLHQKDLLVLNHHRRVKVNENYECIYTDDFLEKTELSYYVFEQPILDKHFTPVKTKHIRYFDYINTLTAFKKIVWKKIFQFKFNDKKNKELIDILNDLEDCFRVELDKTYITNFLENTYLIRKFSKKYYERILNKVNPKAIIQVISYGTDRYIINELAKEKGIPIIELQHGTMGKYHIAYNFANKMDLSTFPDYIFSFGRFWEENTRLPLNEDKIKTVGWPYFEKKVNDYKKKSNKKNVVNKTILFISQGTIGKELSKIALEVSKRIDKNKYNVIYKLHPGEYARWKKEYPWLVDADMEVIDHNDEDMHYYFAKSDIQIGVYSTAIFEGLAYDLKTYIIDLYGHEYMEELYNSNLATLVSEVSTIIHDLEKIRNIKNDYNETYFWQNNSMDQLTYELNEIIDNNNKIL